MAIAILAVLVVGAMGIRRYVPFLGGGMVTALALPLIDRIGRRGDSSVRPP